MKKFNSELIKAIIKTDFFLLENKKIKNLKLVNLTSTQNLNVLDIIELNFCLKQFIRVLQFVKKKNLPINLINSNKQHLKILKMFFLKNEKFLQNFILFKDDYLKTVKSLNSSELYVIINSKKILKNNFLISEINSQIEILNKGTYKIFNNLHSFKKLIFFISIIRNVLKIINNKNNKKTNEITK